jgi:hypothetical protein
VLSPGVGTSDSSWYVKSTSPPPMYGVKRLTFCAGAVPGRAPGRAGAGGGGGGAPGRGGVGAFGFGVKRQPTEDRAASLSCGRNVQRQHLAAVHDTAAVTAERRARDAEEPLIMR